MRKYPQTGARAKERRGVKGIGMYGRYIRVGKEEGVNVKKDVLKKPVNIYSQYI